MLLKDQKTQCPASKERWGKASTGKIVWHCVKSLLWEIRAQRTAQPPLRSRVPPNYKKTFRVKEIKIDYQIRDLMKHTLRVPNLFSSFYEMVSPILSQLLLQFLKYHLHFRPQLCLPDSSEGYRSEPLWLWKMQNFSPSTTRWII